MPIPKNYSAPQKESAKKIAYDQLLEWIVDGTLLPNEKINDAKLASALHLSRTPIREALQLLELQGLVTMKPGVATYVTELDPKDIDKILLPLSVLQKAAAQTATLMCTENDLKVLKQYNCSFQKYIEKKDYFNALKTDEQFHGKIVQVCDNTYIESSIKLLQAHVRRLFFQNQIILSKQSVEEHEQIIEALKNKNTDLAGKITEINWQRAIQELKS